MTARGNPSAVSVQPLVDYQLLISFENGESKIFDMKPMLEKKQGKWYGELLDPNYFNAVRIDGGSVEWPDEQDICPDCLYENSTPLIQDMNPPTSAI